MPIKVKETLNTVQDISFKGFDYVRPSSLPAFSFSSQQLLTLLMYYNINNTQYS